MNKIEHLFIAQLKRSIPENISVTEEIAATLGINYDAAYRRLNNKVSFNLNEVVTLAKKYDISLNSLYTVGEPNSFIVRSTDSIQNITDFTIYLKNFKNEIQTLVGKKEASITFSARELPMFYFFGQPILIRFKIFIWFIILKVTPVNKRICFNDFIISDETITQAQEVKKAYSSTNVIEMWSFGALNNVLQQLLYLHRMRQISFENATDICHALTQELKLVEQKTQNEKQPNGNSFVLYSNDLFMMNNSVILKNKDKLKFGYPYALLKYFLIDDQKACSDQETYINEQKRHAICISNTSTKEHATFFNLKYDKIQQVLKIMKNEDTKPLFL